MVTCMDEAVRSTWALKRRRFYNSSVIIFSSDNDGQTFSGGSSWPLRDARGTCWEGVCGAWALSIAPYSESDGQAGHWCTSLTGTQPWWLWQGALPRQLMGLDGYDVWPAIQPGSPTSPRTEILHNIDPLYNHTMHPGSGRHLEYRRAGRHPRGRWKLLTGDPAMSWIPPQTLAAFPGSWWNLEDGQCPPGRVAVQHRLGPYEREDLAGQRPRCGPSPAGPLGGL